MKQQQQLSLLVLCKLVYARDETQMSRKQKNKGCFGSFEKKNDNIMADRKFSNLASPVVDKQWLRVSGYLEIQAKSFLERFENNSPKGACISSESSASGGDVWV
jgi:hypothetical protein